jgi:hypothetical protein
LLETFSGVFMKKARSCKRCFEKMMLEKTKERAKLSFLLKAFSHPTTVADRTLVVRERLSSWLCTTADHSLREA